jgi:dTDP-glucose 4,6-dehydratase
MRMLITGIAGFFGHHFLEHILKLTDFEVVGLEGINYAGHLSRVTDIAVLKEHEDRVRMVWHDLRSPINETTIRHIGKVDYIIHLAAETHVERSLVDSRPFVLTNVLGTCHLLEYVKNYAPGIVKYVQFSTDEVFGPAPFGVDYKEWDRHKPSNPYAAAKAGADDLAYAFARSFKLPIFITHTMNLFGERQDVEKFIPMTIRKVLLGETVTIHGSQGNVSTRKWIHCRNAADAILFLLDKGQPEDKYNVVGQEMDVLSLAQFIADVIGKPLKYEFLDFHSTRPGHDLRYSLDGSKLSGMGWKPSLSLLDSLRKVVMWTLENRHWIGL